jgi:predicted lipoprotein with Yx(FWY)xxD motif
MASDAKLGSILTDGQGMTLYVFKNDTPGVSNCNDTCAQTWLPLTAATGQQPSAGTGVTGTLAVITRSDGTSQITFNDMPLYRFTGDKQPGDTNGQGMANGLWSVATLTAATPAAPVAPPAAPAETPAPAATPQAPSSY